MRPASLMGQVVMGWVFLILAFAAICLAGAVPAFAQDSWCRR